MFLLLTRYHYWSDNIMIFDFDQRQVMFFLCFFFLGFLWVDNGFHRVFMVRYIYMSICMAFVVK